MSLLTQCPACQTYYRVVPDQLRISDGWVKCGNCSDIFDASQHLIEIDIAPGVVDNTTPSQVSPGELSGNASEITHDEAHDFLHDRQTLNPELPRDTLDDPAPAQELSAIAPERAEARMSDDAEMAVIDATAGGIEPAWVNETDMDASRDVVPELDFPQEASGSQAILTSEPQRVRWDDVLQPYQAVTQSMPETVVAESPVTFMNGQPPESSWHRPLVRGVLTVLAVLLLTMLAGQWVYRERDKLVASHPELKPAFQTACTWLGCEIQAVRQIDALAIDSVAFNKLGSDSYKLSFLVKNASELPLAYPAIELVLTDAEDQPAYRRVFSSAELGFRAAELPAGSEWPVTATLRIDAPSVTQRVFGYRLLVFYP
jgi:predicted Zn finger-like uncharacterized protein